MELKTLEQCLAEGELLRSQPIPGGCVRYERSDYQYSRQGAVTRIGYKLVDLPEFTAVNWIHYGGWVTWPDGYMESFDRNHTPMRHSPHMGYGEITLKDGKRITGTLSRLPNVFVTYYNPTVISADDRATFKMYMDTWGKEL